MWLVSFPSSHVFRSHLCCISGLHSFLLLTSIPHHLSFELSVHGHWSFPLWEQRFVIKIVAVNNFVLIFVCTHAFISLGCIPGVELLGHMKILFNLLRNCRTVFHSSCMILCCHWPCMRYIYSFNSLTERKCWMAFTT